MEKFRDISRQCPLSMTLLVRLRDVETNRGEIISVESDMYTIMVVIIIATDLLIDDEAPQNVVKTIAMGQCLEYVARYNVLRCPKNN